MKFLTIAECHVEVIYLEKRIGRLHFGVTLDRVRATS